MKEKLKPYFTYTRIIALGFIAVIILGTVLLMLPVSSRSGEATPFLNSAFTATSATCVTGLICYDTYTHWSAFGQSVILALIQIGGLGLMTVISMFSVFMHRNISLRERRILMQSAGTMRMDGIMVLIKRIVTGTVIIETAGAVLLALRFCPKMGFAMGIRYAVFHSVSAFCNAGFDIMGQFGESSFTGYTGDVVVNITIMLLIIIGGCGFLVWSDIKANGIHFKRLELHSKLVIVSTAILVFGGAFILFLTDRNAAFASLPLPEKITAAFFQSVTTRTAGFNTVDQSKLSEAGGLVSVLLMLIGGSPGSTAGGIKTTTVAVIILSAFYSAKNSDSVIAFKKKIDSSIVRQAHSIFSIYTILVLSATIIICMIEPFSLREILYECSSAIGTVGISMGITSSLGTASKCIIIFLMYAGRIGGLSLMLTLAEKRVRALIDRPTEKILVG